MNIDPKISESQFGSLIEDLATVRGWLVHHSRPALRQSGKWSTPVSGDTGYPDYTLARDGALVVVEIKTERGAVRPHQRAWLTELSGHEPDDQWNSRQDIPTHYSRWAGRDLVYVGLWRPRHWEHIQEVLK